MGYFPFFMEIGGARGLIVGGGAVAARKAAALLPFGPELTVVAPRLCPALAELSGLRLCRRPFRPEDVEGMAFVIAAADDPAVNRQAAALCRAKGIPVNAADSRAESSFLFPALVRRGSLMVGISTGGASPAAAALVRRRVEQALPDWLEPLLPWLDEIREPVKAALPPDSDHGPAFRALLARAAELGRPLTREELADMLSSLGKTRE